MILPVILALGTLFGSNNYDAGCTQSPYSCGAPSCLSESQKEEATQFCNSHGCGGCAEPKLHDSCYEEFGYCEKQGESCDWKKSPELENCIKKADTLDEACLVKHGGIMDIQYSNCLKEEKKKLFK